MKSLTVYLNFKGNTFEAFSFYKEVFKKDFTAVTKYKDMPGAPPMPPETGEKILHIALPLDNGYTIMGADAVDGMGPPVTFGNNFSLTIECDTEDEARDLFTSLSSGGTVVMPFDITFWGALFGVVVDKFGINWMISFTPSQK